MYLSILMLTGQGEPDGELTTLLKSLCAFTAIFSVAMVAIPASMLTFGFEIEAQRLVLKRRERRLRRRIRAERLENHWIESCSDSEDGDAHFLQRQRQSRCHGGRRGRVGPVVFRRRYGRRLGETQEATLAASAANSRRSRRSTTRAGPWRTRRRPFSATVNASRYASRFTMDVGVLVHCMAFLEEEKARCARKSPKGRHCWGRKWPSRS